MALTSFHFQEVESTQDEAFRLLREGNIPPFVVTCDRQTKGRGRLQRSWKFETGRSLAFSLVLQMPAKKLYGLSVLAGFSIAKQLEPLPLTLKWPNDLMWQDEKIGGILIEARSAAETADVVVGVGLILADRVGEFRGINRPVDPVSLAEQLVKDILQFESFGFKSFLEEIEKRLWKRNKVVSFQIAGESKDVMVLGLTESGELRIEQGGCLQIASDGEILLRTKS